MRLLKSGRTGDATDTEASHESAPESEQTAIAQDDDQVTDAVTEVDESGQQDQPPIRGGRVRWSRTIAYGVLPGLALLLVAAAGVLKWQEASVRDAQVEGTESVRAATDGTVALLSYKPDTVGKDLDAARSRMTGEFLHAYTSLIHDVVIPGAKQKDISAVATVPAAASVSASGSHAVVLLFVNQSIIIGQDAPTSTASSVRVSLDKVDGRWLISGFDPV